MPGQNLIAAQHRDAEFRFQWGDDVERAQIGAGQKDRFCPDRRGAGRSHDRSRRNPGYLRLLLLAKRHGIDHRKPCDAESVAHGAGDGRDVGRHQTYPQNAKRFQSGQSRRQGISNNGRHNALAHHVRHRCGTDQGCAGCAAVAHHIEQSSPRKKLRRTR